jgi:alginate O-acetyltransferase complex protein AlgI
MIFLNYEFVAFFCLVGLLYYIIPFKCVRLLLLLGSGGAFLSYYGGLSSVVVVIATLALTYVAGRRGGRLGTTIGILGCAAVLVFYKYTGFLLDDGVAALFPASAPPLAALSKALTPTAIPLGLSFFTFEFIHYLVDVRRGRPPITDPFDFLCFGLFWPTMVAGPIKRYEQFTPALHRGLQRTDLVDLAQGLVRIAVGLAKKWAADNLTGWITYDQPQFAGADRTMRWVFLAALSARILLDFSGYSDMAIGFARVFGITVPENFNWPYLARSPAAFWQCWHISLSSWIRDYIYIPLGGNRLGPVRRIVNGLTAMALCGLWHGPKWHFAAWGIYHGIGLAAGALLGRARDRLGVALPVADPRIACFTNAALAGLSWAATILFVCIGWLLFFYPLDQASQMAAQLFVR